jgi:hypothetical protein
VTHETSRGASNEIHLASIYRHLELTLGGKNQIPSNFSLATP